MNFDDLQNTWNSRSNQTPPPASLLTRFAQDMQRRRRFQAAWLITTTLALVATTGLAAYSILQDRVQMAQEWGLIPLLLIPWSLLALFIWRFRTSGQNSRAGELPVTDFLQTALNANRKAQTHLKLVGVLYAIFIPALILVLIQLASAGKASPRELASMMAFFGGALLLSGLMVLLRFFRLRPEQKQLEGLLSGFGRE